jgi:ABC-2 type transport system permease protein
VSPRVVAIRQVAGAVLRRNLKHAFKNPALLLPSILFPMFFLIAFAGGLSRIGTVPGFDFPSGYTAFQFVFVFLQSAAFGGVFTGFAAARDFESGFGRRLMLGAPQRLGILAGYLGSGIVRWLATATVITVAALAAGMQVGGDGVQIFGLLGLGLLTNLMGTLWGTGIALRFQTLQAAPLMQTPIFITLFLAPVYVPLHVLKGWIHGVASINPLTALLGAGRGFISGIPHGSGLAYACAAGMVAALSLWAVRGLRRAERGV